MKKLVVSSGAGISAESGITTFRDAGGLWENYPVMDVASHDGFLRNPALIHKFYNERRAQLVTVKPNAAHRGLVELEKYFDVDVITQNVDDLHERAGSSNVLHLHGELMKVRSLRDESRVYQLPCDQLTDKGLVTSVDTRDSYGDPQFQKFLAGHPVTGLEKLGNSVLLRLCFISGIGVKDIVPVESDRRQC